MCVHFEIVENEGLLLVVDVCKEESKLVKAFQVVQVSLVNVTFVQNVSFRFVLELVQQQCIVWSDSFGGRPDRPWAANVLANFFTYRAIQIVPHMFRRFSE